MARSRRKSAKTGKKRRGRRSKGENFFEMAEIRAMRGEYDDAMKLYSKALEAFEENGDLKGKAATYYEMGYIYVIKGDYDKAMKLYSKALKIFKEIDDTQGIAAIHHELGYIHFLKGEYDRAMRRYKKSLKLKEKVNDIQGIAATYYAMANVHAMRKRYAHALILCTQALEMFREAGDTHGMASALVMFGQMTMEVGKKSEGLTYIMQGFVILKKLGAVDAIDALVTLKIAVSKVPESDYQKALSMLSKEERRIVEKALRG